MFKVVTVLCAIVCLGAGQYKEAEIDEDVTVINQSAQNITGIETSYDGFTELQHVDFSNNDITSVNSNAFINNAKLISIDLSGNKHLQFPASGQFLHSSVKVLNMSSCNIEIVGAYALDGMPNLEVLDLSNNPINFEESVAFEVMSNPPKVLIVSKISRANLAYVCLHHADMKIFIKDHDQVLYCRDVKNGEAKVEKLDGEENDVDVEVQEIDEADKFSEDHMEMMMGDEGSGTEDTTDINTEKTENKDEAPEKPAEENISPLENVAIVKNVTEIEKAVEGDITDAVTTSETESRIEEDLMDVKQSETQPPQEAVEGNELKEESPDKAAEQPPVAAEPSDLAKDSFNSLKDSNAKSTNNAETDTENIHQRKIKPNTEAENNKTHENIADVAESTEEASSGSNIILIMVIAAVVIGSVIVGWKKFGGKKTHQELPTKETEMRVIRKSDTPTGDEAKPFIAEVTHVNEVKPQENGNANKEDEIEIEEASNVVEVKE